MTTRAWRDHVSLPQWRILEALFAIYPDSMGRGELAGMANQSVASSGYDKNLSTLRSLGLIDYAREKRVLATALAFPPQLMRRAAR